MTEAEEFLSRLNGIVSVIPHQYVDVLLALHERLDGGGIKWVVSGEAAESLQTVTVEPECLEIVCSKKDAQQLHDAVLDFSPKQISHKTQALPQNAVHEGNQYPVFLRSHYFDFTLNGVLIQVHGDMQYKVNDWEWGDTFEFTPNYINVVGKKTAVTPLSILYEIYASLGWTEKAQRIRLVLEKREAMRAHRLQR